jgi:Ion channel
MRQSKTDRSACTHNIDSLTPRKYRDCRNSGARKLNPPEFKIDETPQPEGIFARIRLLDQSLTFFLAVLILIIFVVFPLAGLGWLGKFIVDLVLSILLLSGAVAANRSRTLTILVVLLTIAGLVVHWTGAYVPKFDHPVVESILLLSCLFAFAVITLIQVFRPGAITVHRVLGAIAAYLLIGLMWSYAYSLAEMIIPGSIHPTASTQEMVSPMARYVYFSFTTLTTLGFGDIVPVNPIARTLAVCEGLIGQLYPAVLIAGLLGRALQPQKLPDSKP